jgi:hypothetical protein
VPAVSSFCVADVPLSGSFHLAIINEDVLEPTSVLVSPVGDPSLVEMIYMISLPLPMILRISLM